MDRLGEVVEQTLQQVKPAHKNSALRAAFPATVPVLTGYLCLGIAYGVLMRTAGYGLGWAVFLSIVCYAGSMEFVTVTLLTSAFDPVQALVMSILVNARHCFYGLSILEKYRGTGWARPFLIFGLTDETFSLVSTLEPPAGVERRDFYFWITLLDYLYWLSGSAIGNLLGSVLPFDSAGMDFALTALFVVLFLEQWKKKENRPIVYPHLLDLYFQPVETDIQGSLKWNGSETGEGLTALSAYVGEAEEDERLRHTTL